MGNCSQCGRGLETAEQKHANLCAHCLSGEPPWPIYAEIDEETNRVTLHVDGQRITFDADDIFKVQTALESAEEEL